MRPAVFGTPRYPPVIFHVAIFVFVLFFIHALTEVLAKKVISNTRPGARTVGEITNRVPGLK
jgi:hypothetical protein